MTLNTKDRLEAIRLLLGTELEILMTEAISNFDNMRDGHGYLQAEEMAIEATLKKRGLSREL